MTGFDNRKPEKIVSTIPFKLFVNFMDVLVIYFKIVGFLSNLPEQHYSHLNEPIGAEAQNQL